MGKTRLGIDKPRVRIRNLEELNLMRKSGQITAAALKKVLENVKVGVSLLELDSIAEKEIKNLGGTSSFKSVPGYNFTTCLTLNDEVVHGLPRKIKLKEGDLLGIDLGAAYKGWHTDVAWSVMVNGQGSNLPESRHGVKGQEDKIKFLEIGERTLWEAIDQAVEGKRIGDISATIEEGVERAGYSVVKSLAGHGVGRSPHEEPVIPTFGQKETGLRLQQGMTVAIEVIYTAGKGDVYEKSDGWTIASIDHSLGGLFEMSVIVGKIKAEVLTDWRKVSRG